MITIKEFFQALEVWVDRRAEYIVAKRTTPANVDKYVDLHNESIDLRAKCEYQLAELLAQRRIPTEEDAI